jgi:hypothetical protein
MILLVILVLAFLASLFGGGRIERLAQAQIRLSYLILLGLGIQILIFSSWWREQVGNSVWFVVLYVFSMFLSTLACWINRNVAGMGMLGIGVLCNTAAILLNGGHMPAPLGALQAAGLVDSQASLDGVLQTNSSLLDSNTRLWFLCDIFALPRQVPLANVYSVGDVFIALGAGGFVWANMRVAPPPETPDNRP